MGLGSHDTERRGCEGCVPCKFSFEEERKRKLTLKAFKCLLRELNVCHV
jgi:hypothetical protein